MKFLMQSCSTLAASFYQVPKPCSSKDGFSCFQTLCQHEELRQLPTGTVSISSNVIRHLADGHASGKKENV